MEIKTLYFCSKKEFIDYLIWQFENSELIFNKELLVELIKKANIMIYGMQLNYSVTEIDGELGVYRLILMGRDNMKKKHGIIKGEYYWEGELIDTTHPDTVSFEIGGFPREFYTDGKVIWESEVGVYVYYTDADADYEGYYDLIDQEFKLM